MAKITALPTRDAIRRNRRDRLENGMTFPLEVTSLGFDVDEPLRARVRRISTIDSATLEGLPDELKQTVFDGLQEFEKERKAAEGMTDPENLAGMLANNSKIVDVATAWCKAAFINPRLYDTEAEAAKHSDPDPNIVAWLVDDVDPEDRVSLFMACVDSSSPAMRKLKVFRPEREALVQDDAPRAVAETAV